MRASVVMRVIIAVGLSTMLACTNKPLELPAKVSWATEIERNRNLWRAANLKDYKVKIQWRAMFQHDPPLVVSVSGGKVVSVVNAESGKDATASERERCGKSIEEVFDILTDADRRPLANISATFDSSLGYPLRLSINWNRNMTDTTEWAELELQGA